MNKRIAIVAVLLVILLAGVAGIGAYTIYSYSVSPAGDGSSETIFVVKPGQGFSSVCSSLVTEKLVKSPEKFKILGAVTGNDKKIKAGEYLLSASMTPSGILKVLTSGRVRLYSVTIPEGYNIYQVAETLSAEGLISKEAFLKAVFSRELMGKAGLSDSCESFEGYLFPDTYKFPKGITPWGIIKVMVARFRSVYVKSWVERAEALGFTVHEIVTLASIIEKETGDARERPIISSVFHNRLRKRMRLETDPTVIYGIKDFDGNITKKHLRERTPYNTYRIKGLPPGPIANPGMKSLEAALYPADTDYLFFVSKKDSTHQFSTNIRDHINSVRKYQLRRR